MGVHLNKEPMKETDGDATLKGPTEVGQKAVSLFVDFLGHL